MTPTPLPPSSHGKPVDSFSRAPALERDLLQAIRGEVRFDRGTRALYASDASNYRQVPIGLVVPRDDDDVRAAVGICRQHGAPVLPRGAGTSLAGQSCNVAVVLDFSKYMNQVLEVDPVRRRARVQPGVVLDTLRAQTERQALTFGPDPSTHSRCTLGGMIGNNSCGTHSLLAGKTVDNVESLRVLLYDGTELVVGATPERDLAAIIAAGGRMGDIYARLQALRDRSAALIRERFPDIPRRVSGYNLDQLLPEHGFHVARALVGSEGTCAVVLEATVRLIPSPPHRSLVGLGYADAFAAADHVMEILAFDPIGLEGFEGAMVDGLRKKGAPNLDLLPEGRGFLLVEFGAGDPAEADAKAARLVDRLRGLPDGPAIRTYTKAETKKVWRIREAGPRAASNQPGQPPRFEGWDDSAVPPQRLGAYLRELRALLDAYGYDAAYYGHFGHGCIHMQVSFDLQSAAGVRQYGAFIEDAADLVVKYGGSISGEHGDGQARGVLLPRMFGPELMTALAQFKSIWDPENRMNPNKLVHAHLPTEDLRLGADYRPWRAETLFALREDGGSLARASLRCIGVGECRKQDAGTMCPSYMATLEEEHSTRGRARMLFELLQGEVLTGGWQDEHVKRSLDLCLSCKACKAECPTNVDIATYRSEFLWHYYETRRRPLQAYAFGFIDRWLRLAAKAPAVANLMARAPGVNRVLKAALHVATERELPVLAPASFQRLAASRGLATIDELVACGPAMAGGRPRRAILWVDTFNNYLHPKSLESASRVLGQAGIECVVPGRPLCCGRPLYDFGLLHEARAYLRNVLDQLGPSIQQGTPMVVLEPSCASVFRDELTNLLPDDPRAHRLRRQTYVLSEFLQHFAPDYEPRAISRPVLLQGHCHQRALMSMDHTEGLLRRTGASLFLPDAGCCGMAGPFGFAASSYPVSQRIGERVLFPAVRSASPEAVIVADGFSCREQIRQATGRPAIHLAELLDSAWPDASGSGGRN